MVHRIKVPILHILHMTHFLFYYRDTGIESSDFHQIKMINMYHADILKH